MARTIFITGGAGFIGSNLAAFYIKQGERVIVFDNLSRPGVQHNLDWLKTLGEFVFIKADIRDYQALTDAFTKYAPIDVVFHEASQTAVTTSVKDPREDFEVNAYGTFNVLEAIRNFAPDAAMVFASTNKVFGNLEEVPFATTDARHLFQDERYTRGITEQHNLDFHSPYGCSKGAADQYVRDYARIYGLKTVVFRQSCIYGYRQIGLEDQGWLAWFLIRAILDQPITIFGDGKQVRDVLFIDDLIRAYDLAVTNIDRTAGHVYNIGGGVDNTLSLLETMDMIREISGKTPQLSFADWRPGDQRIYISNIGKATDHLGWTPAVSVRSGLGNLHNWLLEHRHLYER